MARLARFQTIDKTIRMGTQTSAGALDSSNMTGAMLLFFFLFERKPYGHPNFSGEWASEAQGTGHR
jgi:hypothetical protein